MRNFINIVENAHTPPERELGDEPHYDALAQTGFFGAQGAGCVFVSRTTGRIMLVLRSASVEQPFTWGNCGGAHHTEESPIEAARREAFEETGFSGALELKPALVFQSGTFRYSNFIAVVEEEFIPDLGWEADDYVWCTLSDLPHPLHFGIEALLADHASVSILKSLQPQIEG